MKKLGFGLMRLPLQDSGDETSIDLEKSKELIDRYMKEGFSYFDTAMVYQGGAGEKIFGKVVADRYPRDSFFITTKLPSWKYSNTMDFESDFQMELDRLHLDYVDNYYIHAIQDHNMTVPTKYDQFGFLRRLKEQGKTKNIGFSFHGTPELLDRLLTDHPEVDMVQLQLNFLDWEAPNVRSRECHEVAVKHGVKITVMEPLKGGTLVDIPAKAKKLMQEYAPDAPIASWGLRFAASLENVMVVLSGMNRMEQVIENTGFMKDFKPMNDEEKAILKEVANIIREDVYVPCTNCHYCIAGCPKHICIPDYFNLFNDYKRAGEKYLPIHWNIYHSLISQNGMAADCVGCRQCERQCPQHIPIVKLLKEFSDAIDFRTGHDY